MESRRSSQAPNLADRRRTSQARDVDVGAPAAVEPPQRISVVIQPKTTDAFTVLPPIKAPPPPPSAPTPYRVAAPRKKKNSFVILAENGGNATSPQGSRSPSPSGRVSPFRGRGFKPPSQPPSRDPSPSPKKTNNATYSAKKPSVVKGVQPSRIPISPSNSPKRVAPTHGRRASVSPGRPPMSPQRTPAAKTSMSLPRRTSSIGPQPVAPTSPRRVSYQSSYTPTPAKPRPTPTSPRRKPSHTSPQPSAPTSPRHAAILQPLKGPGSPKRVGSHQSRPQGRSPMLKRQNNMNPLPPRGRVFPDEIITEAVPPSRSQSPTAVTSPSRIPVHQRKRGISPGGLYSAGTQQGPVGKPPIAPKTPKPNPRNSRTKPPEKVEYVPTPVEEHIKVTIETPPPAVQQPRKRPRLPLDVIVYALPTMAAPPKPTVTTTASSFAPSTTTVTTTVTSMTPPTPTRPTRVSVEDVATSLMERAASVTTLTTTLPASLTSSLSTAVAATRLVASVPPKTEKLNEMVAQSTSMTLLVSPPPPPPSFATPMTEVRETKSVAKDASSHIVSSSSQASVGSNSVVGVIRAEVTEAAEMLLASEAELPEEEATSEIIRPNVQSATAVGRGVAHRAKTPSLESITSAAGASGAATTVSMSSVRTTSAKTVRDPSPVITSPKRLIHEEAEMESLSANNLQRQARNDRPSAQLVSTSNGVHQPAPAPAASPKTAGCCTGNGGCSRVCQRIACCRATSKFCDKLNCCKGVNVKTPACCSRIAGWFRRLNCSKLNCCAKLNCCKSTNCCTGLGNKLNCCKAADCCKKKPATDSNGNKLHCCKKLDCCPRLSSCCRRKNRDGRDAEEGNAGYCCSPKSCFPRCCSRKNNASSDIEIPGEEAPGCWDKFKNSCCKKGTGCCAKKKPGEKGTPGCFACCGGKKGAAGEDAASGCFGRCCSKKAGGAKGKGATGCFGNCCKKKGPGAGAGAAAASKGCCGGKTLCGAFKACFATMFCLNAACCRVRKDSQDGATMEAIRKRSNATRMSKKKTSVDPERLKLDLTMVDTVSIIRASIPVLPVFLAWTCLVFNVFLPGTGTVLSGFLCLCLGRARFSQHDDIQGRIQALILDIIVGVGQAFTIMFCLVGWGWSIWWGVIMVKLARKYQKMQKVDPNAPETLPAHGAAGARNHVDIERGRH